MIPIACKITDFFLYLFVYFFENIIILVGLLCKEEWLACALRINYWNNDKPVCFILNYVLSVTQQYKQKTA